MSAEAYAGGQINILVVDDRPENVTALSAILDRHDYNVVAAGSGTEALKRLLEIDVAVILLDVRMPGMDGFETARRMRQRERMRSVPIIFLTADAGDLRLVDEAYAAGAVDYLVKPLDPAVVRAKVAVFAELFLKAEQIRQKEEERREIDRRRSAALLAESEELFETTFQEAAIGIAHVSPDGRWLRANTRLCELIGEPVADLLRLRLADVVRVEDLPALQDAASRMLSGGEKLRTIEVRFAPRRGADVWVRMTMSLLRDASGTPKRLVVTADDVTERRRAAESQRFLSEASELLIGSRDHAAALAGVARLAVPRVCDLCIVELAGEAGPLAVADVDEERGAAIEQERREASRVEIVRDARLHADLSHADGTPAPSGLRERGLTSAIVVPLIARGRALGAMTFAVGVRRPYSAADLELAEDLAHRAALAIDNARLFAQAQDAIRVRDEFLSIASHELRTPLTPLQLQLQRLLGVRQAGLIETLPPDRVRAILARCERQVTRLASLIDDLLDVSRITSGRLKLDVEYPVDLTELVREITSRFQEEAHRASCAIVVRAPEEPVEGAWDRLRLEQVMTNLVSNALKYGAGTPIEVIVEDAGDAATLIVRDEGIGIAQEKIAKIFDRFERGVSARAYGGLGLGLYIARQIVDAHKGSIHVVSEPGHGAAFTVELPKRPLSSGTAPQARGAHG